MALSGRFQLSLIGRNSNMAVAAAVMLMCGVLCGLVDAHQEPVRPISSVLIFGKRHKGMITGHEVQHRRRLVSLVEEPPMILFYHNGPIMSAQPLVPVYIIWYGSFNKRQMSTIRDFFSCFCETRQLRHPSVKSWWNMTAAYKDNNGLAVAESLKVEGEVYDRSCSKGLTLTNDDLEKLVVNSLNKFPTDPNAMYLVLTANNVFVEDFCMNSCASHFATRPEAETKGHQLAYAWVGNSATQCPGECAWPFARADYGPPDAPLTAPNGDVGADGMIINLAAMLAGSATNPFNNGFYQGDASAPLEAATACTGMYGAGAYPGFPGELMMDKRTGASFNVRGIKRREFLLPALWNPYTFSCTAP